MPRLFYTVPIVARRIIIEYWIICTVRIQIQPTAPVGVLLDRQVASSVILIGVPHPSGNGALEQALRGVFVTPFLSFYRIALRHYAFV